MKISLYAFNSDRQIICYPNKRKHTKRHGNCKPNDIIIEEEKIKMDAREVMQFSLFIICPSCVEMKTSICRFVLFV